MNFYEDMSSCYDEVFPKNELKVNFLTEYMNKDGLSVDIACGVGTDVRELMDRGFKVEGLDLDNSMISEAKRKSEEQGVITRYITGSMLEMEKYYGDDTLTNVLCTGNSLVHLPSRDDIFTFIQEAYRCLEDHGKLIIQIINFDRILDQKVQGLPTIINEEQQVKFVRKYEHMNTPAGTVIKFIGELEKGDKKTINSVNLLALRKNELIEILKKVGFKSLDTYGNFKGEVYGENSYATIVVAKK
ncbi:class I SAM-dependent methyltransferase [Vallitalea okinawensis]|uniref:class I SAM-dependent methyltransferase n=1 Tax=Vallitalea okinawensis TaxID=2078660 RepID=UPI000CFAE968|nr:class I SAM-dependent methyltransferase [Vallitalea okinawensis]